MFDRLLLIACICIVVALVLYFFYWNRFIGFLIGQAIRFMYWNQEASSIWVEIGSIHFSLLAGRILLKDIRYHSSNQTVKIVKAQVQWRYWIRRPTTEEEIGLARGGEDQNPSRRSLSCRIHVSFQGFQWFLYNRTAAYDNIISQMKTNNPSRPVSRSTVQHQTSRKSSRARSTSPLYPRSLVAGYLVPRTLQEALAWVRGQLPSLDPKDLLPFGIEITKGAIICGNSSTPNLLVAEFRSTEGTFGIVQSKSEYDLYKQILSMKFQNALIRYVENEDYVDPMITMGELVHGRVDQYSALGQASSYLLFRTFVKLWRQIQLYSLTAKYQFAHRQFNRAKQHQIPSFSRSHKKSMATPEDVTPLGADFTVFEYAVERNILEAPILELSYYTDVVGEVPPLPHRTEHVGVDTVDIGNGDVPPEWGADIVVRGGVIRYGPWADRQRAELQRAFFPPTYQNVDETPHLNPGDSRVWTSMRVFIELQDDTTLYIPFREASKNWQWDGQGGVSQRPRKREPASIHITAGDRSSINYIMPMVASPTGYEPALEVHLDTIAVTSSLNDIRLVSAESSRIRCDLPSPLKWNSERKWTIAVSLQQPVLYLLRDHINMFTDLAKDWTTGPPSDYQRFIPMLYAFELHLHHFELNLYANDHNIIDKPLINDENALLIVRGAHLRTEVDIPSNVYRPEATTVPFSFEAPNVFIDLSLPRWNTHAIYAPRAGNNIGTIGTFKVDGSYRYYAEVGDEHIEQLKLTFMTRDLAFKALGWSIRYFMVLRDNYLGSFTHFSTLFEYLDKKRRNLPPGDPIALKYREGKANMLQVELALFAEHSAILLPAGIPGCETSTHLQEDSGDAGIGACLVLDVPELQVQFRMHDYYMDMSLNVDTISGFIEPDCPEKVTYFRSRQRGAKEIFLIDGIDITAHRVFGPQPRTVTYLCIWEIRLGQIRAVLSALDGKVFLAAGNAFKLSFSDLSNAPAPEYLPSIDPDVTFYKLSLTGLDVTWRAGQAALVVTMLRGLKLDSNDLCGQYHRKVTNLKLPHISVKMLLTAASDHKPWLEAAEVIADAYLSIYSSPSGWHEMARAQIEFVEEQDRLTGRARRMLRTLMLREQARSGRGTHRNDLYLPQPGLSSPTRHRESGTTSRPPGQWTERPPRIWRMSNLTHLSESDEGVSEADRDARLAKTRSSTPIIFHPNEESMTSGDESDDEDLTDGSSSDSDWSDLQDLPGSEADATLLMYYSHITRHYLIRHSALSTLWDGPLFVLSKERPPLGVYHSLTPEDQRTADDNVPLSPGKSLNISHNTTTYRLECHKTLDVKITPLIIPALAVFEADMEMHVVSPELYVDSLIASYLGDFLVSHKPQPCTVLDAQLPSVVIYVLQHIPMMAEGQPGITIGNGIPSGLDIISILEFGVNNVLVNGSFIEGDAALSVSFDHLAFDLNTSVDKRTIHPASTNEAVFSCSFKTFKADLTGHNMGVKWDETMIQMGHLGTEYMTATCLALAVTVSQIATTHRKWKHYTSGRRQTIIFDILHSSKDKAIVDPLSTIQPSYLVQSGTPHELRIDTTFRFLFHLRTCLWYLKGKERDTFRSTQDKANFVALVDLVSLLESRLIILDQDAYNITHLSSLEPLFPGLQSPHARQTSHPLKSPSNSIVSVRMVKICILILEPTSAPPSELLMTDIHMNAQMRTLEVVQSIYPRRMSQTSLRDRALPLVQTIFATITLGDIALTVFPHLMLFAQHILRIRRRYSIAKATDARPSLPVPEGAENPPGGAIGLIDMNATLSLRCLHVQAAAENLVFDVGASNVRAVSCVLSPSHGLGRRSMNHSILFDEIYIRARSPATDGLSKKRDNGGILASVEMISGRVNLVLRDEQSPKANIAIVFGVDGFRLNVPRSALRLYRFVEEWRADFLPGIDATIQALLSELQKTPSKPMSPITSRSPQHYPVLKVHGQIQHFGISLQVMHGTWLSWEVDNIIVYLNSHSTVATESIHGFGLQVASQVVSVSSKPNAFDAPASTRVRLTLPPLSLSGNYDGTTIHTLMLLEFVELKVKPSHWDTLLVVQQKFGQDFNDLVGLIHQTRKRPTTLVQRPLPEKASIKFGGFLKMRGFRVGLESLSSTVYLECLDIGGGMSNADAREWHLTLSDLALSLASRTVSGPPNAPFNRDHRSAFVIIDFDVRGGSKNPESSSSPSNERLTVSVTKIHAVMQPSSIGEVGDFIDHMQAEILDRKEQRALELAAFKEKTQSILKTFEVRIRDDLPPEEKPSLLADYIFNVLVRNVGVAFPLTHDEDLEIPQTGSRDSNAIRAFLFSIKSIEFGTHRGETGQAVMKDFSFQFVPRFRQSVSADFSGENHQTRNRLIYPEMKAQLRSDRTINSRHIWMSASVSGFILDLDPTVPDYVFSLVDVYRQGKERVEKLSSNTTPRTPSIDPNTTHDSPSLERHYTALPTSNVFASLTFLSGKVRVYNNSASTLSRSRSYSRIARGLPDDQVLELGAEVFNLPVVSVWAEYRATPASHKLGPGRESEPSILMFKSTVHSSQNTLRPTLLPFLTELVSHVETRLRKVSSRVAPPPSLVLRDIPTVVSTQIDESPEAVSSMRISFSLRIDQSKLELTCQPDVNVVAGLHWDSGGFVVNVSPGARKVTFTGSVGGLTLGLKHGFLSEDCVKLDARNLAFSVTFAKMESGIGTSISSISVVLDTEFLGGVRFSRLQDILCFKAVWLDRIPIFNGQHLAASKTPLKSSVNLPVNSPARKLQFTTVILVRIRQIQLEIDLGQSISTLTLDLKDALLRTKLTETVNEVSLFVGEVCINAKGNVAGHANVPHCVFRTVRQTEGSTLGDNERNRMLELRMTSGALVVVLESDHQKLLHYRAEPLEVEIFDDWPMVSPRDHLENRPLRLAFTITSPEIVAAVTVGAIPKLLSYANKFRSNLDAQREGASRESKAFRVARSPKPDNPLSAVAEAMLHSARSRFKEETGLSYVIKQHMSLRLGLLRLAVFPRTMGDFEIAQFIGRDVRARLDRLVESEVTPAIRDLRLSFSSMTISKFSQLGQSNEITDQMDGREWLVSILKDASEAIIVGLPSMKMHMVSEETLDESTTNLHYDFHSEFVRREGMKHFEDIYITLNVSLYSWLTVLRKTLTREMDQVKAASDWRTSVTSATNAGALRKKGLESVSLQDATRSFTLPHPITQALLPSTPGGATRLSTMDHSKSTPSTSNTPTREQHPSFAQGTPIPFPVLKEIPEGSTPSPKRKGITYHPRHRRIERLTMRQLGEATPDVMHPFFMKKAGFNLEDSLPQYVNEYATMPLEEIMEVLLKLYSKQLLNNAS